MRNMLFVRVAPLLALALAVAWLPAAGTAAAANSPSPGGPLRARVTGRAIPGTSIAGPAQASAAPAGLPSKQNQIKVLTRVLHRMQKNYKKWAFITPGPQDIFDYGIGSLWQQGIDGAGTTIAVIEGWNYPGIAKQVAGYDKLFGLPNPKITTIYPAGKLPSEVPAGHGQAGQLRIVLGLGGRADARRDLRAPDRAVRQDRHLRHAGGHPGDRRRGQPGRAAGDDEGAGGHRQRPPGQRDLDQRRHRRDHLQPRRRGDHRAEPGRAGRRRGGHPGAGRHRRLRRGAEPGRGQRAVRGHLRQPGHRGLGRLAVGHRGRRQRAEPEHEHRPAARPRPGLARRACSPRGPGSPRCTPGPATRTGWPASPAARCARCRTSPWTPRTARPRRRRC